MNDVRSALRKARSLSEAMRTAEALAILEPAAAAAREGGDPVLAIEATLAESLVLDLVGDLDRALARATWAISAAHAPENRAALGTREAAWSVTQAFLLFVHTGKDNDRVSIATLLRVLDEADLFLERTGRLEWRAGVASERAGVLSKVGRYEEAIEARRSAIEGMRRHPGGPGHMLTAMRRSLAFDLKHVGRLDEAAAVLTEVLGEPGLHPLDELAAHTYLGHLALKRGDRPLAERCAREGLRVAAAMNPPQRIAAAGLAVEVFLAIDAPDEAAEAAAEVMACARAIGNAFAMCAAHQDAADVALYARELDGAREHLAQMERFAELVDARTGNTARMDAVRARQRKLRDLSGV